MRQTPKGTDAVARSIDKVAHMKCRTVFDIKRLIGRKFSDKDVQVSRAGMFLYCMNTS